MNTNTAEQTKPAKWTFNGESVLDEKGNNACTKANGPLIAQAPTLLAQRDALAAELSEAIRQRDALAHELSEAAEYIWARPRYGYTAEASQKLESMVKRWRSTAAIAKHL